MHTNPRNGASIDRIYLHTNEGPEQPNGADGLAHYLLNNGADGGGYHIVDGDKLVRIANDDEVVWGAGGDNTHALHLVFEGYANQTPEQWADAFSKGELYQAAEQVATWCQQYNVPPIHVAPGLPGQAPTERGIAEHADDHSPNSQGHTDPGSGFPIDAFVAKVNEVLKGRQDTAHFFQWVREVWATPLRAGESGWKITSLKQALAKLDPKYDVGNDHPYYGPNLVKKVGEFKVDYKDPNHDGHYFGGPALQLLLNAISKKK